MKSNAYIKSKLQIVLNETNFSNFQFPHLNKHNFYWYHGFSGQLQINDFVGFLCFYYYFY